MKLQISIMCKISYVLCFAKNILLKLEYIAFCSVTLLMLIRNQKVFKSIGTGNVRYENKRTSSISEKIKTKQFLLLNQHNK